MSDKEHIFLIHFEKMFYFQNKNNISSFKLFSIIFNTFFLFNLIYCVSQRIKKRKINLIYKKKM